MRTVFARLVLPILCTSSIALAGATAPAEPLVLTHVTVIDCTGAKPKPDQAVVIEGDRITKLGPSDRTEATEGARVVDAAGKFLDRRGSMSPCRIGRISSRSCSVPLAPANLANDGKQTPKSVSLSRVFWIASTSKRLVGRCVYRAMRPADPIAEAVLFLETQQLLPILVHLGDPIRWEEQDR
jgi:hypothetical protein